jgi:hypothetical protein
MDSGPIDRLAPISKFHRHEARLKRKKWNASFFLRACLKSHFFFVEALVLKRRGLSKPHPDRGFGQIALSVVVAP